MTNQGDPCIRKECNGIYIWKSCKTCGRRKIDKLVCNICGIATGGFSKCVTYNLTISEAGAEIIAPIVYVDPATDIYQTSAILNGTLADMGNADFCLVWFEWGLTPVMGNKTPEQTKASTGSFWADLSGLTANTTYYFEAFAKNGGSW